ncbi:MAG: Gfo/Idh/MocA family oxidoreductase [Xenococcus sp. MO_188.B8]|nr:Gfo/Idh/MocA family oxidoreductase [Xenococcus sp. MO_188.B8]
MSNINIGIIGTGKFAKEYYFPAFASYDNINLYAIANRTSYKAWQTAKKYGIEKVLTGEYGWKKLVKNNNIDAIANSLSLSQIRELIKELKSVQKQSELKTRFDTTYKQVKQSKEPWQDQKKKKKLE